MCANSILDTSFNSVCSGNFVALAIATTGLRIYEGHKICCISAIKYFNGRGEARFEELVNPHRDIPWEARKYNGIDEHKASLSADFYKVWLSFIQFANDLPIVVYSGAFVKDFIDNELPSYFPHPQLIDVMGMIEFDIGVRVSLTDAVERMNADVSDAFSKSKVLRNAELLGALAVALMIKKGNIKVNVALNAEGGDKLETNSESYGTNQSKVRSLDDVLNDQENRLKAEFEERIHGKSSNNNNDRDRQYQRPLMPKRGRDIHMSLEISLSLAYHGGLKEIDVPGESTSVELKIPAGIRTGDILKCIGRGRAGQNGGKAGDLYINFRVKKCAWYRVDGYDLHITHSWTAGDSIELPELLLRVDIPRDYPLSESYVIDNMGLKYPGCEFSGKLYIHDPDYRKKLFSRMSQLVKSEGGRDVARNESVDFVSSTSSEDKGIFQKAANNSRKSDDVFGRSGGFDFDQKSGPEIQNSVQSRNGHSKNDSDDRSGGVVIFIAIIIFIIYLVS